MDCAEESRSTLQERVLEEQGSEVATAAVPESSIAMMMLRPNGKLGKMATSPKTSSVRRVIFPELYHGKSSPAAAPDEAKAPTRTLQKPSSFDSSFSGDRNDSFKALLSPTSDLEASPKSVTILNADLPMLPSLAEEPPKFDLSSMIIPPFVSSTECSNQEQPASASVVDTPGYRKRLVSPFVDPFQKISLSMTPKLQGHPVVHSILRKKVDSVPSMVSMSSSEGSLPDLPRRVGFDPRVWVCEFQRDKTELMNTWFSSSEMDRFKRHAIDRIHSYSQLVPTGTGRLVRKPICSKAFFTHPALSLSNDEDVLAIQKVARTEINNILVIDPHDLCAKLFKKLLQKVFPHATVVTVKSSDEAINRIKRCAPKNSFDIVLVEERLKLNMQDRKDHQGSGSALIRLLKEQEPKTLFIGVSAHYVQDKQKLEDGGADLTWSKPPPPGDCAMRSEILKKVLFLRGKEETSMKYFA